MSLEYLGIPDRCEHGMYKDIKCPQCQDSKLEKLMRQKRRLEDWLVFKLCQHQGLTDRVHACCVVQSMLDRDPPWETLNQSEEKQS